MAIGLPPMPAVKERFVLNSARKSTHQTAVNINPYRIAAHTPPVCHVKVANIMIVVVAYWMLGIIVYIKPLITLHGARAKAR